MCTLINAIYTKGNLNKANFGFSPSSNTMDQSHTVCAYTRVCHIYICTLRNFKGIAWLSLMTTEVGSFTRDAGETSRAGNAGFVWK